MTNKIVAVKMQTTFEWIALIEVPASATQMSTEQLIGRVVKEHQVFQELLETGQVKLSEGKTTVISTQLEDT